MEHESERNVPLIENLKYTEKNYLTRKVVRPKELQNLRGGDLIDILYKPVTFSGGGRVITNKVPLFNKDGDKPTTIERSAAASPANSVSAAVVNLPDLGTTPRNQEGSHGRRNHAKATSKTTMNTI